MMLLTVKMQDLVKIFLLKLNMIWIGTGIESFQSRNRNRNKSLLFHNTGVLPSTYLQYRYLPPCLFVSVIVTLVLLIQMGRR
jgi:hypothetical protein